MVKCLFNERAKNNIFPMAADAYRVGLGAAQWPFRALWHVARLQDPLATLDLTKCVQVRTAWGQAHGQRWRPSVHAETPPSPAPVSKPEHPIRKKSAVSGESLGADLSSSAARLAGRPVT